MLPFGVTIPATVPQGSEIPEGLMNNPVDHVMFSAYMASSFITLFHFLFLFCITVYMVVCFVCLCLILQIMYFFVMFMYSYCNVYVFLLLRILYFVLLVCKCVLYYCHRVSTQLQLTNISYKNYELWQSPKGEWLRRLRDAVESGF